MLCGCNLNIASVFTHTHTKSLTEWWILCKHQELDFWVEAKNSEKCLDNFRKLSPQIAPYIYAPKVYWSLSTKKLLTMEYMDGAQINDVTAIRKLGVQPHDVAKLVSTKLLYLVFSYWLQTEATIPCSDHVPMYEFKVFWTK